MYTLDFAKPFNEGYKKLVKRHTELVSRIDKALGMLAENPFHPSLHTHKVDTRNFGKKYSSRVTGDIRIIWDYPRGEKQRVLLLAIDTHRVYK